MAENIVDAVLKQGFVKAKADKTSLIQRVVDLIVKNFEEEAKIEADAEKMAQQHIRRSAGGSGMDERRVIDMIKKKLAEDRGFSL